MAFSAATGGQINQTGTDTDLSGLVGLTDVTTTTVGSVTIYFIANRNFRVAGTCTMDPASEMLCITSTSVSNQIDILNGGTFNVGGENNSAFGSGGPTYGRNTAIICGKDGPGCCSNGSLTVRNGGTLNWYGSTIHINAVVAIEDGATVLARQCALYSQDEDGNTRVRCNEGSNIDIDDLETYGVQWDWLVTETFGNFVNFLPVDRGQPIENATGTAGVRAWREMPDNRFATDALMNNWQGNHDVTVTLAEVGTSFIIVPDSTSSTTAHGGRIYHEYTVTCRDVDNVPIQGALTFLRDTDNGQRITTDTFDGGGGTIADLSDQVLTGTTGADGQTPLETLLLGTWFRRDNVGDLAAPNGNEEVDIRGKNHAILAAIGSVSGVSATFTSSDSSLPLMVSGDRFTLNGSTSNDDQLWEVTNTGTAATFDADRLNGNATAETENAMELCILGEDEFDVSVWSYLHLPFKFQNQQMNGLQQTDLVATLLIDSGITETNRATVDGYNALADVGELYDSAKAFKVTIANLEIPDIDTALITANGSDVDLGALDLIIDGNAGSAFAYAASVITIRPGVAPASTTYGQYTFDTATSGDELDFTFTGPQGGGLTTGGTQGVWNWDNNDTPSTNVGPSNGQGGSPDGYIYTEMSGQSDGDTWTLLHDTTFDADANNIDVEFYWAIRGDAAQATIELQTNENGAGWVTRYTTGFGVGTVTGTGGATVWNLEQVDLSGLISNASTEIRWLITADTDPSSSSQFWHNDVGFDSITITETPQSGGTSTNLDPSAKFTSISTTGDVTTRDGATIDGLTINGDVTMDDVEDWTNVTVNGDLTIGTAGTYNFSNVTVTGDITNSDGAGNVQINASNGSSLSTSEPGTGNGLVNIVNTVTITVTARDAADSSVIEGARVFIEAAAGGDLATGTDIMNTLTNASGIAEDTTFNFTNNQPITGRVRKGTSSPYYKTSAISGTITSSGFDVTVFLVGDE